MPYGLLLNELVSNACKHAFPAPRKGRLEVSFERDEHTIEMTVADSGRGLPIGFDYRLSSSLGLKLMRSLARQLRGSAEMQSSSGTTVRIRFPESGHTQHA
ncbi:MAG: ATP-binding protein [Acidobacteriaceae bacterium]|nr:ATP-binding protein [Acidobacteriaceae bacterium]